MRIIIRVIDLRGVRVGGRRSPRDASVVVTEVVGLDAGHLFVDEVMYGSAWEVRVEERNGVNDTSDVDQIRVNDWANCSGRRCLLGKSLSWRQWSTTGNRG